ncbi:MAG: phosphatidylglycerophosphatase A family protein [Parvibaculales bacterium]
MIKLAKLPPHLRFFAPAALVASFGGCGLLRPAPGTWGALAATFLGWVIASFGGALGLLCAAALAYIMGLWATHIWLAGDKDKDKDPASIVIDEVAGQWLTLAAAPLTLSGFALGFILFRLFDILKPHPVRWADKKLAGAQGVMLDDILAGILAAALLLAAQFFKLL